jgi:hypothetical protein
MTRITLIIFFAVLMASESFAQNGGFAGAATRLGFGPRAMGMGNAYTATTSEGIYSYYNPALVAFDDLEKRQFDLTASSLQFDRIYQTMGIKFDLPPNAGLSFGLIRTGVQDIDERTLSGYPLGTFDLAEYQFLTSFGIRFSPKVHAGLSFKLGYANYHSRLPAATSVGVDLGILYRITDQLNFGFTIQDMFANYTWNSADLYNLSQSKNVINNYPVRFKWGFAWQQSAFTLSTEFEVQSYKSEVNTSEVFIADGSPTDIIEDTKQISTSSGIFRIGGAWKAHERFTLRGGFRIMDTATEGSGSLTTGFSINLPFDALSPSIDYAFVMEPYQVANMHVFALRLHL